MLVVRTAVLGMFIFLPEIVAAQVEISIYGGAQKVAGFGPSHGLTRRNDVYNLDANRTDNGTFGLSDIGLRVTWWQNDTYGWGLDLNHPRQTSSSITKSGNKLNALYISDSMSLLTLNAYRRWITSERMIVPYIGAGLGVGIPDVAFKSDDSTSTRRPTVRSAAQWFAGASYPVNGRVSVFGEYRGSYDINSTGSANGVAIDRNAFTTAINVGVSLGF